MNDVELRIPYLEGETWCRVVGDLESGTPLVVLHGGPGFPSHYLEGLSSLARPNRPVVFYDQLDTDRTTSSVSPADWWFPAFIDQFAAVHAALGHERVDVLGHSWGGMLAIEIAAARPELLNRLILSNTAPSGNGFLLGARQMLQTMSPEDQAVIEKCETSQTFDDPEYQAAIDRYTHQFECRVDPLPESWWKAHDATNREMYQGVWGPSEFTATGPLGTWDATNKLPSITHPTLIISGEFDGAQPVSQQPMLDGIPNAQWERLDGCSHMPHLEDPARYERIVESFLAQ